MENNKAKWIILLIGIDVTWGMMFVINDYLLEFLSPELMVTGKLTFAALISLAIVLIRDKKIKVDKKDWAKIIIVGLAGMFIYNNLEGIGIDLTSASVAALILATIPIFTAVADLILYGNKVTKITMLGISGSIAGVVLVTLGAPEAEIRATALGIVVMIVGACVWAFYMISVRPIEKKYDPLLMVAIFTTVSALSGWILICFQRPEKAEFNFMIILLMIVGALLGFVVTQYFYIKVLKHINVTMVAIFENLIPVTSVVASFILFGDLLTAIQFIGAVTILLSVTLVSLKG